MRLSDIKKFMCYCVRKQIILMQLMEGLIIGNVVAANIGRSIKLH